jgi:hypothetical protein
VRRPVPALAAAALAVAVFVSAATAENRAAPACTTAGLVVWLNTNGDGAAGSVYFRLEFTNLSSRTCSLNGYPGVSAVDLAGRRIGSPATRNPSGVRAVRLANGGTANAVLRIVAAGNYPPSRCHPRTAAGLRVYPPNRRTSKVVPFPLRACAKAGVGYLSVGPLTSGPGSP